MGEEPESEAILLLILDYWREEKGNRVCNPLILVKGLFPLLLLTLGGSWALWGREKHSCPALLDGRSTLSRDHQMSPDTVQCPWGVTGPPPPRP